MAEIEWFAYYAKRYSPIIRRLTEKQRSDLLLAIDGMCTSGELPDLDLATELAFSLVQADFEDSVAKMQQKSETNRQNAIKGQEKRKATASDREQSQATAATAGDSMRNEQSQANRANRAQDITIHNNTNKQEKETEEGLLRGNVPSTETDSLTAAWKAAHARNDVDEMARINILRSRYEKDDYNAENHTI